MVSLTIINIWFSYGFPIKTSISGETHPLRSVHGFPAPSPQVRPSALGPPVEAQTSLGGGDFPRLMTRG